MKMPRDLLDRIGKPFHPGGRLQRLFPLYEAADTFFYAPGSVTKGAAHVRDALDLKRMMLLVVIACLPCVFMAMFDTGLQANLARQMSAPFTPPSLPWWNAFIGLESGSMGETSALACLFGAVILIATGIGSWRIMAGVALGTIGMASLFNAIGPATNPYFAVPFWWHMVAGGWAFATVFMATDPVTSPFSDTGRWIYGLMIGVLVVMIRVLNPAYPESVMLVILFMNVVAPFIDYVLVQAHLRRWAKRRAET